MEGRFSSIKISIAPIGFEPTCPCIEQGHVSLLQANRTAAMISHILFKCARAALYVLLYAYITTTTIKIWYRNLEYRPGHWDEGVEAESDVTKKGNTLDHPLFLMIH